MKTYLLMVLFVFPLLVFGTTVTKKLVTLTDIVENKPNNGFIEARLENKSLYLGIPKSLLDKPMLLINHQDRARLENKYVLWTEHGSNLFLKTPGTIESSSGILIPMGNEGSMHDEIIATFPINELKSNASMIWVNASDLFLNPLLTEWKAAVSQGTLKSQSFIKGFKYFENELVVKVAQVNSGKKNTWIEEVDYSLFLLPKPMKSRPFDHRMGFFSADNMSFNTINYKAETPKANIARWRLEKKNKGASISEPVKPITFILPDVIPKKWRPYVKAGILEWLPAFEAAGFKNALEVKEETVNDSNPYFHSVHHNLVIWGNKANIRGFENKKGATAFSISDLRSGEILKSNIHFGSSYQSIMDRYIVRCAPLDFRAQQYPLPDELLGKLIQSTIAHEAGHAFGLMDAHYGEYSYPFEKMRDEAWLEHMGHTPSIMNYARQNYIPQPEDSISPSLLIQKVGPTDIYNIKWAYTPFNRVSANEEKVALENSVREQDSILWYRYNKGQHELVGPGATDEVVESNNPVESTKLGLKNMKRVLELLPEINKNQSDYSLMERLHETVLELWFKQMRQVLSLVGGYTIYYKSGRQKGDVYTPIALNIQQNALMFFIQHTFNAPDWLINPSWMKGLHYSTYPDKLMDFQMRLLMESIGQRRLKRLAYLEEHYPTFNSVTSDFLIKIQNSLFNELEEDHIQISFRRQQLQQVYVEALLRVIQQKVGELNAVGNVNYNSYSKSLFFDNLLNLKLKIASCVDKKIDVKTSGHLKLILNQLNDIE
ncbi:zinc-dependent metalloprotease [Joostella sp.]|uniref:zinc-dependent metalloprotease n=1 Tax=Joostella sp. TaxID=2231138 RepID=UPI003A90AE63